MSETQTKKQVPIDGTKRELFKFLGSLKQSSLKFPEPDFGEDPGDTYYNYVHEGNVEVVGKMDGLFVLGYPYIVTIDIWKDNNGKKNLVHDLHPAIKKKLKLRKVIEWPESNAYAFLSEDYYEF